MLNRLTSSLVLQSVIVTEMRINGDRLSAGHVATLCFDANSVIFSNESEVRKICELVYLHRVH